MSKRYTDSLLNTADNYISCIKFNNNELLHVNKNDIVVFVGPNNVGKSQALKDIFQLTYEKGNTTVINDIKLRKGLSNICEELSELDDYTLDERGHKVFNTLGSDVVVSREYDSYYGSTKEYGIFRDIFVANLSTENRLSICYPANNISRKSRKTNPIHYAAFNGKSRKWLSDNFKKAFGEELTPNTNYGNIIPLCIGPNIRFDMEFDDEQSRQEEYARILSEYKQVQDQGDGIKSFTGILLYLMVEYYHTFLIDEPESFLHPPQANIMGRVIGESLSDNQQAFISTHSEEIVKGLLSVCPERLKIVRISRNGDYNSFAILKNENISSIWNDSLLKYSNIMQSLFHKNVVICESDSDCKFYSIIDDELKRQDEQFSETLFIHCNGKHRIAKVAKALLSLDVDVKVITDIDIYNSKELIKELIEVFGIQWDDISSYFNSFTCNLHSEKEQIRRDEAKKIINDVIEKRKDANLSSAEIKEIQKVIKVESKWDRIKDGGISAIPSGDATAAYKKLDNLLKEKGIFVVNVGVLEGFVKEIGGHGPEWVNNVLETYPDLEDDVYNEAKLFVRELAL